MMKSALIFLTFCLLITANILIYFSLYDHFNDSKKQSENSMLSSALAQDEGSSNSKEAPETEVPAEYDNSLDPTPATNTEAENPQNEEIKMKKAEEAKDSKEQDSSNDEREMETTDFQVNPPNRLGHVNGTITWQYNKFVGTKGDVGAYVYLIPTDLDVEKVDINNLKLYLAVGTIPQGAPLFFTKADGYGNYELNYIPEGEYILIFSSENTKTDPNEPIHPYIVNLLQPVLKESYQFLETVRLNLYKSEVQVIQIKNDRTLNESYDFGYTYF
ncbi:hypothetical protein [Bacillus benzoevorans]|uniref:Uncharacterized protein n=1 Tax=Bacillus benzoevorans TaxID=1456 RepID=A0A7X0LX66_9BACI|nr:hypothetical protein [Bacillus benzoevorans]MBB6447295.1 hypothetical protein [Bacillus benzoevorans]